MYGVTAVRTVVADHPAIVEALLPLCPSGRSFLHHYDETAKRRIELAQAVAGFPLSGAIILTETTANKQQERARANLLSELLPRLQHSDGVGRVVIESRGTGDQHDKRTRDRLRRTQVITSALRLDFAPKRTSPLVWLPDLVIGCYFAACYRDEPEPWDILRAAHDIEIRHLA